MDAYDVQNASSQRTNYPFVKYTNKPIMLYYFVDPFCHECWFIDVFIKKMSMQYGAFLKIRPIISHLFSETNHRYLGQKRMDHWSKYYLSVGIKAAGLQGNKIGRDFLRNVQEAIFLYQKPETIENILIWAAKQAELDLYEFNNDLFSSSATKAYQGDMQLIQEMNVTQFPTLVFFSQYIEDYSVKVSGLQSFETYTYILKKMLQSNIFQQNFPPLEAYLKNYTRVQTDEIAFIFDSSIKEAEKVLKQLQLKQKVKKVEVNGTSFWEYEG